MDAHDGGSTTSWIRTSCQSAIGSLQNAFEGNVSMLGSHLKSLKIPYRNWAMFFNLSIKHCSIFSAVISCQARNEQLKVTMFWIIILLISIDSFLYESVCLQQFLGNLRNLRDSHAALAFGSSETSEGPSSVTKIISECESALTDLNRSLGILSASIAREQGNKMSTWWNNELVFILLECDLVVHSIHICGHKMWRCGVKSAALYYANRLFIYFWKFGILFKDRLIQGSPNEVVYNLQFLLF